MANENVNQNKSNQVKVNPSRYNGTTTKGQNDGTKANVEIDTAKLDNDEVNLDRSGINASENIEENEHLSDTSESENFDPGLQAGSGADYGSGAVHGTARQESDSSGTTQRSSSQLNRNQDDSKLQ